MRRAGGLLGPFLIVLVAASPARAGKAVDGVVNINTAELGVLGLLPGVSPAKAAQIAAYRKRHPFRTVDELVRIRGIGRKMVRRLRAHLAVSGPTTASGVIGPAAGAAPIPVPVLPPPPPRPICVPRPIVVAHHGLPARPRREPLPTHGVCPPPR
jgi:competence protein ComEA